MPSILVEIINEGRLDNYLSQKEKGKLKEIVEHIKPEFLYKSPFHGLYHSEKVLLFAYLIGIHEKLTAGELEVIVDAAIYHDIGRENDYEDTLHGYTSARIIDKVVGNKSIYQNKNVLNLLRAICDGHSLDDSRRDTIMETYELPDNWQEVYIKLYNILKDADALDRARFKKISNCTLKEKFLRIPYSKQLVDLAYKINECYFEKISETFYQEYANHPKGQETVCYHGIGYNFVAFDGILDYGILSSYAKKKNKIGVNRNFHGNNNDLWISVSLGNGESQKEFIDNGISFEVVTDYLESGISSTSKAKSEGLPIDSKRYSDERFAFYEIPKEHILKINVNKKDLSKDIAELNYLNGSRNYDSLVETIDQYLNYLRIKHSYFPNIDKIEQIKAAYREELLTFESKSQMSQKSEYIAFFATCDAKTNELNKELQKMISEAYQTKYKKDKITLYDVISSVLLEKGINFDYKDGSFSFKSQLSR